MFKCLGVAALALSLSAACVQALTFDLFWSSDPEGNADFLSSDDPIFEITGTLGIEVAPGNVFGLPDTSFVDLSVTGGGFAPFKITSFIDVIGNIAPDGLSAAFANNGQFNRVSAMGDNGLVFGCPEPGCEEGFIGDLALFADDQLLDFDFTSADTALASFELTRHAAVVPLPARLPMAMTGLVGLLALRAGHGARV